MSGWPVDSTEARELRQAEALEAAHLAQQRAALAADQLRIERDHTRRCTSGWLDDPNADHPRPCPRCRPHTQVQPCRTCGVTDELCNRQVSRGRGRCCDDCRHSAGA